MVDISVIIVSWNVADYLRHCLDSLRAEAARHASPSIEVVVVDNDSTDGTVEMARDAFPEARLIVNSVNVGFTRANNQGISVASGRFILLLNPDTEVLPGAMEAMVAYLDAHPQVGSLGPELLNSDGSHQSSRRRFPTLATAFVESTILQSYLPNSRLLKRYYCLDLPAGQTQEVDWLVGACLIVRREAVENVGLLDEGYFMYSEELDWCYRIKKAGWKVVYLPEARVVHHYARSSSQVLPSQHIYFQSSKCRYFGKYHGWAAAAVLRGFLWLTYLVQLGQEGVKFVLGHKRALRRQRLGLLLAVLRSGLRA